MQVTGQAAVNACIISRENAKLGNRQHPGRKASVRCGSCLKSLVSRNCRADSPGARPLLNTAWNLRSGNQHTWPQLCTHALKYVLQTTRYVSSIIQFDATMDSAASKLTDTAPRRLVLCRSSSAAVQQRDQLVRKTAEVDQDALLRLEARKVVLAHVQRVQEAGVALVGQPHPKCLRSCLHQQ